MVAVLGISESSKADLLAQLDQLGHQPPARRARAVVPRRRDAAARVGGADARRAPRASRRSRPCATSTASRVRRNDLIDEAETGGIAVAAADPALAATVGARAARRALPRRRDSRATRRSCSARTPPTSSGSTETGARVYLGGRWFTVVGDPRAGRARARARRHRARRLRRRRAVARRGARRVDGLRARRPGAVEATRATCSARPRTRSGPRRSRSRGRRTRWRRSAAAKTAFTSLFLGLGAVALLVGGVGIANVMVISVLERRSEVGLRRALGAPAAPRRRAVPLRVAAAGGGGRARGRRARRGGHRGLRGEPGLGAGRAARGARRRPRPRRC